MPAPALGRDFRRLCAAATVSAAGDGVRVTALPLYALRVTDDPGLVSGVVVVSTLPWLLCSLLAGALTDRVERRRLLVVSCVARGLVMAAFAAVVAGAEPSIAAVYAVAFAQGIGEVFGESAAFALLPAAVPADALERANGRLTATTVAARSFVGPALGGLLFAWVTPLPFVVDAVSFLLAATLLGSLRSTPVRPAVRRSVRADIADGVRWLAGHRTLRVVTGIAGGTNLVLQGTTGVLVVFATRDLGLSERGFGILLGVESSGILLGGLAAHRVVSRFGVRRSIVLALGGAAVANLATAAAGSIVVVGLMAVWISFSGGLWSVTNASLRQRLVPGEMLGRVQSAHRLVSWGAMPLGAFLGGVLGSTVGVRAPFAVAGVVLLGLAAAGWAAPAPRQPSVAAEAVPALA